MKISTILLTLILSSLSFFSYDVYGQNPSQPENIGQSQLDSLQKAATIEEAQQKEADAATLQDAKQLSNEAKSTAKEAQRVEQDATSASTEARKAYKTEKKAQKMRSKADKQAGKATDARNKSDLNY
jgi:hypothetical protein